MHFFNPAPLMELVEVISGPPPTRAVTQTIFATATAWGKVPVVRQSTPGFIVNRVARPFYGEGAAPAAGAGGLAVDDRRGACASAADSAWARSS